MNANSPRCLHRVAFISTAAVAASTALLWAVPLETGKPGLMRTLEGHTELVRGLAISPDGRYALSCSHDQTIRLWDLRTGKEVRRFEGHRTQIRSVAFSPDGKLALSSGQDGVIVIWDVTTGEEVRRSGWMGMAIPSAVFAPDGKTILAGLDGGGMRLLDAQNFQAVHSYVGHTSHVVCVTISRDSKIAASAGEHDHTARLWEVQTRRTLHVLRGHREAVHAVALSPDGRYLLTGGGGTEEGQHGSDNVMILWDAKTGKEIRRFTGFQAGVWAVAFSPDGTRALAGSGDWTHESADTAVRLWDLHTGKLLRRFEGHDGTVWSVAFLPDGRHALSCGGKTLKLWRLPAAGTPATTNKLDH